MNRSFGGSLDCNSVNYNKGKSFRFSEWNSSTLYSNDDYIQDFVSYMGSMYACIQTNTAVEPTNELYWKLVVSGQPGVQGKQGNTGVTFTPHVDADGNLSWTNDGGLENPQTVNIKGPKGADSTVPGPKGDKGDNGIGLTGPQGRTGEMGIGLEFNWDGTKLGIKRTVDDEYTYVDLKGTTGSRGLKGNTGNPGPEGPKGPKGDSLYIQVSEPNSFGQRFLQKRYSESEAWVSFFDLSQMKGPKGDSIIVERNLENGNIEYRYENQPSSANKILIYKDDIKGPKGDTIAKTYVADDGYLYIQLSGEDLPRRVGYVRGDRGADGREIVLRVYTGPSEDPDDPRIGTHLQWKYAGDEYKLWTNLIQINDLMNIALSGIKIEYKLLTEPNEAGVDTKYNVIELNTYQVEFDEKNNLVLTKKIANLSSIKVPIETHLRNVTYTNEDHTLRFFFDTATGEDVLPVSLDDLATEFIDKIEDLKKQHELDIQELKQSINNINKIINDELRPNIQKNTEDIAKLREDLTQEITDRTNADNVLQNNLDAEISRATEAEENLRNDLNNEITRAKEQEAILQDNIDNEVARAQAAEDHISQDLANEIDRATRRETELQEAITAETNRATEAEQTLQNNIDNLDTKLEEGLANNKAEWQAADQLIQNDLNDLEAKHDAYEEQTDTSLTRMYPKVFPLAISVSGGGTFKSGTTQTITVRWNTTEAGDTITPTTVSLNNGTLDPSVTSKVFNDVSTNTTYTVKVSNSYEEVSGSTTARFVNPNYFGVVSATEEVTSDIILGFSELIRGSKSYTGTTSLNNQRTVYAYPKSFGALTSIKDANNFDYINSYTRSELEINGETYYVYVLTSPTSITTFKQIYA